MLNAPASPVISRHRLPTPYRVGLSAGWLVPIAIMLLLAIARGGLAALREPGWITCGLLALPALYVWREGVDVLAGGVRVQSHGVRRYPYDELVGWREEGAGSVLRVWARDGQLAIEARAGHLTHFDALTDAVRANIREASSAVPSHERTRGRATSF